MSRPLVDPWVLAVRARRIMVRPVVRRLLVLMVAAGTGLTVVALVRSADQARDRWGATRTVAVARHDLAPGETIDGGSAELRELPEAAVATEALAAVPVGAVVRQPVAAGEPLLGDRIAPGGLTGVAALVPAGHRAIAIPVEPLGVPRVVVGDQVDVLAVLAPAPALAAPAADGSEETDPSEVDSLDGLATVGQTAMPVVERAVVVDVADGAVTIAVAERDVPAVATALAYGPVLLTLAGA